MSVENYNPEMSREFDKQVRIQIEPGFDNFIPQEFKADPLGYFESWGKNIKTGDIKKDEDGRVREDPTAVKDLPVWTDDSGQELQVVAKRVNIEKGQVGKSRDPFYEYEILKKVQELNLPGARPIAKIEQAGQHLILMERLKGVRWSERKALKLEEKGYTAADMENLRMQAEAAMQELQRQFDRAGIIRGWKLKDMVFDIDFDNKKINKIIPTDWERTKIVATN